MKNWFELVDPPPLPEIIQIILGLKQKESSYTERKMLKLSFTLANIEFSLTPLSIPKKMPKLNRGSQ